MFLLGGEKSVAGHVYLAAIKRLGSSGRLTAGALTDISLEREEILARICGGVKPARIFKGSIDELRGDRLET